MTRDMEADVYSKLDKDGAKKMIKDINGNLVTEKEVVLKVYSKELLNKEGNNNDEELPMDVEGKEKLTDITDTDMQTGMKGMKKGRAPGTDDMHVEMVMAAGESGISWTKRLLNTCMRKGKGPEEW